MCTTVTCLPLQYAPRIADSCSEQRNLRYLSYLHFLSGEELLEGNMNEGGWNLVEPEHAKAPSPSSQDSSDGSVASMAELSSSGKGTLRKEASFAWRGGQERQTTGMYVYLYICCSVGLRSAAMFVMLGVFGCVSLVSDR